MKSSLQRLSVPWAMREPREVDREKPLAQAQVQLPETVADIYDAHFDFVWRNARRLGVPEASADDVVQDVFIVVQRRIGDFDGRSSMQAWIMGILLRVVSDHRRNHRRKAARNVPLEHEAARCVGVGSDPSPSELAERAERLRLLERLLGELDESKRTLLILSELEEWTLREIAEFFDSNISTIYSRLRAAKRDFELAYARAQRGKEDLP